MFNVNKTINTKSIKFLITWSIISDQAISSSRGIRLFIPKTTGIVAVFSASKSRNKFP